MTGRLTQLRVLGDLSSAIWPLDCLLLSIGMLPVPSPVLAPARDLSLPTLPRYPSAVQRLNPVMVLTGVISYAN